ncbi:zinc transporter ZIP13 homolog [Bacillus rossius redtenbacheri]|uniref:zinc transporter ZIP13 homolog n=1 Tax=Bacillus rossius redtenbacheri TaxID=93214 RepID=UPI002FDC934A
MCSLQESDSCHVNGTNEDVWRATMLSHFIPEVVFTILASLLPSVEYQPIIFSMIGSSLIGLSGVFPLLVIPIEEGANLKTGAGAHTLKVLLSFAVGCLLGDVFLHLLPEVWHGREPDDALAPGMSKGLWVLTGLLIFVFLEKVFGSPPAPEFQPPVAAGSKPRAPNHNNHNNNNNNHVAAAGDSAAANGRCADGERADLGTAPIHVSGYLNLMANSFDNFTHGLAVGGSFLVSAPHGVLTTLAILLHEIPHEVGDFAILLRSGFSRWEAARAQVCTASGGMLGALFAVVVSGAAGTAEARTSWIMPFTAGGFLHIALVTVLPDLLEEESPRDSLVQLASLLLGVGVMAGLSVLTE